MLKKSLAVIFALALVTNVIAKDELEVLLSTTGPSCYLTGQVLTAYELPIGPNQSEIVHSGFYDDIYKMNATVRVHKAGEPWMPPFETFTTTEGHQYCVYEAEMPYEEFVVRWPLGNAMCDIIFVDPSQPNDEALLYAESEAHDMSEINPDLGLNLDYDFWNSGILETDDRYLEGLSVARWIWEMEEFFESTAYPELFDGDDITRTVYLHADIPGTALGRSYGSTIEVEEIDDPFTRRFIACHEMSHTVHYNNPVETGEGGEGYDESWANYFPTALHGAVCLDLIGPRKPLYDEENNQLISYTYYYGAATITGIWWDIRVALGNNDLVDKLVWKSREYDNTKLGRTMQSILLADDDNDNLADGTPHLATIQSEYANWFIGPEVSRLFYLNQVRLGTNPLPVDVIVGEENRFAVHETYPWDWVSWDFGDGTSTTYTFSGDEYGLMHTYALPGVYTITSTAHFPWAPYESTEQIQVNVFCEVTGGGTQYIAGNANGDDLVDVGDAVFLINYVFRGGLPPNPIESGDANGDCGVNVGDAVYLIDYVFKYGDPTYCSCTNPPIPKLAVSEMPEITLRYDDEITRFEIESQIDLYGLQIELSCDSQARIRDLSKGSSLLSSGTDGNRTVGMVDLNGAVQVPAGRSELFEIEGQVTIISAIGVDDKGNAIDLTYGPTTKNAELPGDFRLYDAYPNPFNPTTTISYDLPAAQHVTLEVINLLGQRVARLVEEYQSASHYELQWDGADADGSRAASGVYFYRLTAGDFTDTKKMVLMK